MKTILFIVTLAFYQFAQADNLALNCTASVNYENLLTANISLSENQSNYRWGEYQDLRFLVSRKESMIELQLFNGSEPSRTYATSDFSNGNSVELTVWKSEFLLSLKCTKP